MDTNERLRREQHGELKELQKKLGAVLEHEPADSEDTSENEIWEKARDLKASLDDFFTSYPIKAILRRLHGAGGCDAEYEYSKGWDAAIGEAIKIVEAETGIGLEEVLE